MNVECLYTVKPVNNTSPKVKTTHGLYRQVFFTWSLFVFVKAGVLKCDLYLQSDLYSEVAFNTGLTVQYILFCPNGIIK